MLALSYFHHSSHNYNNHPADVVRDAKTLVEKVLSAPREHKQRILYEFEKLKEQVTILKDIFHTLKAKHLQSDIPIEPLISEAEYMKEIGEDNAEIKRQEDFFRRLFVSKKEEDLLELSRRKQGDDILVDFFTSTAPNVPNFNKDSILFDHLKGRFVFCAIPSLPLLDEGEIQLSLSKNSSNFQRIGKL